MLPNPTAESNWVFPGKLALGAFPDPGNGEYEEYKKTATATATATGGIGSGGYSKRTPYFWTLMEGGFNTFVCCQTDEELTRFRSYRHLLLPEDGKTYIQFGLVDNDATASDKDLLAFVDNLSALLDNPAVKLYLHCHGGHGRSGSVAVLLLIKKLGLTLDEALVEANKQHETRGYNPLAKIPQSEVQMKQLRRIYNEKLTSIAVGYWSIRGLGAPLRMMVLYCGAMLLKADCYDCVMRPDGTDDRSQWLEDAKPALKERNALINLPYVIDGDIVVTQSNACAAYLGRKLGMMGSTIQETSQIEQLLCEAYDIRSGVIAFAYGRDSSPFEKFVAVATATNGSIDKLNLWLSRKVSSSGLPPEFFVGTSASVADFCIWEILDQIQCMATFFNLGSDPFANYPRLGEFLARFKALPNNARYFSSKLANLPCNNISAKNFGATPNGHTCTPDLERYWQGAGNASGIY